MQGNNRNSAPYISHLLAASSIVLEHRGTEDQAISALLHDSIKYGPRYTKRSAEQIRQEIQEKLGREVLAIVESCSDINTNSNLSWRQQKEQFIARISNASTLVRLVSAADKLHKARTILNNYRKDWNNYNYEGEKEDILWYFNALIEAFSNKGDIPELVEKLSQVVEELKRVTGETESSDIGEP
jgi:(p)ppGpp synthase/HD superfamily hydrolase